MVTIIYIDFLEFTLLITLNFFSASRSWPAGISGKKIGLFGLCCVYDGKCDNFWEEETDQVHHVVELCFCAL